MSLARFQICKVFEDLEFLLFEFGIFLGTSPLNCTRVVFWEESGMLRKIFTHKNGNLDGFYGTFYPIGHPEAFIHYRHGQFYGEAQYFNPRGVLHRHLLYTGNEDEALPFTERRAADYPAGYRFSKAEWNLAFDYYDLFVRGWYKP